MYDFQMKSSFIPVINNSRSEDLNQFVRVHFYFGENSDDVLNQLI